MQFYTKFLLVVGAFCLALAACSPVPGASPRLAAKMHDGWRAGVQAADLM